MAMFGSDGLQRDFLPRLLTGDLQCCLLYSEPGAGSDLAGLRTSAVPHGETYVVNGQKVWSSGADRADYALLLARTNWDAPKHGGITFFWFPMRQPGVDVRPIRQITGASHFNEVFITDARVPRANVLGPVDAGWRVLQSALAIERSIMGEEKPTREQPDGARPFGPGSTRIAERLLELAAETGRGDPVIRQEIARVYTQQSVHRWTAMRAATAAREDGSSSLASLGKLSMSRLRHHSARVQARVVGAEAMLDGASSELGAESTFTSLNAFYTSIGGGTDQIQQNILAERVLGLPKDVDPSRNVSFREVMKCSS
jgi:alkylation response protein AidB-like acyl-CoA dehydrogenase